MKNVCSDETLGFVWCVYGERGVWGMVLLLCCRGEGLVAGNVVVLYAATADVSDFDGLGFVRCFAVWLDVWYVS